jgi:diguanylate cyclase (GGDEF)-like protein
LPGKSKRTQINSRRRAAASQPRSGKRKAAKAVAKTAAKTVAKGGAGRAAQTGKKARKVRATKSAAAASQARLKTLAAELKAAKARIAELERRADTDVLVDALNRRGMERVLRRSIAYVGRYPSSAALLYLDVNRLKPLNDRHGHAAGDAVLKAVTGVLNANVRKSDVVARLSGDEFAVLVWNVTEADAAAKAMSIEDRVARLHVAWPDGPLTTSIAAGFAMLQPSDTPQTLLDRADRSMYVRKQALNMMRG